MITPNIMNGKVLPVSLPKTPSRNSSTKKTQGKSEFEKLLNQKMTPEIGREENFAGVQDDLKFSKHAMKRLFSREINIGADELKSLKEVVKKLKNKGARESLILMNRESKNNLAVVVSVRNKTVITAMNSENMKENIFTNIDSTVVL